MRACTQDGVDFLVAETADGRMDLSDAFYFDAGIEMYARPKVEGVIPSGPRHLQVMTQVSHAASSTCTMKSYHKRTLMRYDLPFLLYGYHDFPHLAFRFFPGLNVEHLM